MRAAVSSELPIVNQAAGAHVLNGDAPEVLSGHAQPIGFRSVESRAVFVHEPHVTRAAP